MAAPSSPGWAIPDSHLGVIYGVSLATLMLLGLARRHWRPLSEAGQGDDPHAIQWSGLAPSMVIVGVASVLLVFCSNWGRFVADTKIIFFWNPDRGFAQSLQMWNGQRDLGAFGAVFTPLVYAYNAVFQKLGLPPWAIQRLFHATLLAIGGIGAAVVCRRFFPRHAVAPAIAGLWFVVAPFTARFLTPSGLYLYAALCPWLVVALSQGVTTRQRWRWAGVMALLVAIPGTLNVPAFVWSCLPLPFVVVYLVLVGETTWPTVARFATRAAGLIVLTFIPAAVRLLASSGALADNLAATETAQAVSQASSWPESLRGLGEWLTYFTPSGQPGLPYLSSYFSSWWMLALTFVPVAAAFAVVVFARPRARLLFGAVLIVAAAVMVGAFPVQNPSPGGRLLLRLYELVPASFALRNTYKAGAGLLLCTSVLFGVAVAAALRRWPSMPARSAVLGGVVVVVVASSTPFWTGALYAERLGVDEVPGYWTDAIDWLGQQPGPGRVMVAQGTVTPTYRWGSPTSGDLFPSLLDRSFVLQEPYQAQPADALNLVRSVDADISSGLYTPGSFAPVARRLGIEWLVVRNDLDWQGLGLARPSALQSLRDDPALEQVATFGVPGQNVVSPDDHSTETLEESTLPPVEVYRVREAEDPVRVVAADASQVVSGDGAAWPGLAASGALDDGRPVRYSGRMDVGELTSTFEAGGPFFLTDTNRRTRVGITNASAPTLSAADPTKAGDLFGSESTQTVADFSDASIIRALAVPRLASPSEADRPAAAFDGDPRTAWIDGIGLAPSGQGLFVGLRAPKSVSSVDVTSALPSQGYRAVLQARLEFSDGTTVDVAMPSGRGVVRFAPKTVSWFRIVVTEVEEGGAAGFGFSEIAVSGLDLTEFLRTPVDVADAAATSPDLSAALARVPSTVRLQRKRAAGSEQDPETALNRIFTTFGARSYDLSGSLAISSGMSDAFVASLVSSARSAAATSRLSSSTAGPLAVDGDLATGWSPELSDVSPDLTLTMPVSDVSTVDVVFDESLTASLPGEVEVTAGGRTSTVPVLRAARCRSYVSSCPVSVTVPLGDAVAVDQLVVRVRGIRPGQATPMRVLEVRTDGAPNPTLPPDLAGNCREDLLEVDGRSVPVRVTGSSADLLAGRSVPVEACGTVSLDPGRHTLVSPATGPLADLALSSAGDPVTDATPLRKMVVSGRSGTSLEVSVDPGPAVDLLGGQGYDRRWSAASSGEALNGSGELDVQSAWRVPPSEEPTTVTVAFGPQRRFDAVAWCGLVGVLLALAAIVLGPRERLDGGRRVRVGHGSVVLVDVGVVMFGALVGGLVGLLVCVTAVVARRSRVVTARSLGIGALALVVVAVVAAMPPVGPAVSGLTSSFVSVRQLSTAVGRLAGVLLAATIGAVVAESAAAARSEGDDDVEGPSSDEPVAAAAPVKGQIREG